MSSQPNEITYEKEFAGNLHGQIEPVPARVTTRLRVMTDERAREVKQYAHHHNGVPLYMFSPTGDLPLHPSLQAMGRHYFTW